MGKHRVKKRSIISNMEQHNEKDEQMNSIDHEFL